MKKILLVAFLSSFLCQSKAQLVINEIMQSNVDCILDDLNQFPDSWVELYNAGSEAVELSDYALGETEDSELAWRLPSGKLGSKCYRIIYCDTEASKDRKHTDFHLNVSSGAQLFLFKDGKIVDQLPDNMKKIPAPNIAFGRKDDGSNEWDYQAEPTPEKKNCGTVYSNKQILADPEFSVNGMVFTDSRSFDLVLSVPKGMPAGTVIRYTADGSEPTLDKSTVYENPIKVQSTKIIRAKLFCDGYLSPRSVAQSYIKLNRKQTLPVVSIVSDRKFFYDNKIGIFSSSYTGGQQNYKYDWRRPVNIELFEYSEEESVLNQLVETRVSGAASRDQKLKSLAVYAKKRFGESRMEYEFFPEDRPGITDYTSLVLRNAGNDHDYLYMRDAIIQRTMGTRVDVDWQAWSPVMIYLNGSYLGMLNIRERANSHNIYTNYNGLEDIDLMENWYDLKAGTKDNWKEFEKFYKEKGHTYQEFEQYLDVEEFMNVMILNTYFCNLDFPGNNIIWWRPREEGGRWRVILKDTDFGLGLYGRSVSYDYVAWLHNNNYDRDNAWANKPEHTQLFRTLEDNEEFKQKYIDRFVVYMGDFLNYDGVWETWEPMYNKIKTEYPNHRKLINEWWPNYTDEMNNAKKWLKNRNDMVLSHIKNFYKLDKACALKINESLTTSEIESMSITINDIPLTKARFNGKMYANRKVNVKGTNVSGWKISWVSTSGTKTDKELSGSELSFTMPECSSYSITAIPGTSGIEETFDTESEIIDVYDVSGVHQSSVKEGLNVIRKKDGTAQKIWK